MSKKEALRDLQQRLAARLQEAQTGEAPASWLAVVASERGFLFPLAEAGEIFAVGAVTPVPHTADWFPGVANLRGQLHGVVNLARFVGLPARALPGEGSREQARLITLNASLGANSAVLVDQLAGLRRADQLTAEPNEEGATLPRFVGGRYRDAQGRVWQELKLSQLIQDEHFLRIGA